MAMCGRLFMLGALLLLLVVLVAFLFS